MSTPSNSPRGVAILAGNRIPFVRSDGLLMAPVQAVPRMLKRAGLALADFDFYEIHEAFASQVPATLAAREDQGLGAIDRDRLNVTGSSAKLLAESAQQGGGPSRGLISICAAGGQGVTAILERP
jgi:acetyl-CoA C-acetyltransferase